MRKVVMLVTLSGERHHFIPGEEVEFEADEAQRLVDGHFAKYVDSEPNENQEKPIGKMTKDELLEYAVSKGIEANAEMTKKDILALIENSEPNENQE